jgi:multiple sugar transport system permease protein
VGWLFLAPTLLILGIFGVLPFIYVLIIGFADWNTFAMDPTRRFAGVENYRRLVFDGQFLKSLWLTLQFAFWAVLSQVVLGYFLAQLLMKDFPLKGFFRTIHTLPLMVAPIAVGATWRLMTVPGLGPLPYYLDQWFGITLQLGRYPNQAFATTVIMDVWHWTPLVLLIVVAALASIDRTLYDAARVDGASEWQVIRRITLPLLAPTLVVAGLLRAVLGFKVFDEIYLLTNGGPAQSTEMISTYVRRVFIDQVNLGYGAFLGLSVLVIFAAGLALYGAWRLARGRRAAPS